MAIYFNLLVILLVQVMNAGAVTEWDCSDTFHTDGVAYFSWKSNSSLNRGTTTWGYSADGLLFDTIMFKANSEEPAKPNDKYDGLAQETCPQKNYCPSGDTAGMTLKNATSGFYRVTLAYIGGGGQQSFEEELHVTRRPDLNESTILESCGEVRKQIKATYPLVMRVDLRKARITPPDITIHDGDTSLQCRQSFYCELTINSNKAYAVIDLGKDDTVIKAGGCLFHPSYPMMLGLLISLLLKFKLE